MNADELKLFAQVCSGMAEGKSWECLWNSGWGSPAGRDLEYCITHRIPIRLVEQRPQSIAVEETIQTICELYNAMPEHAVNGTIETPAEEVHNLAVSHHKQTMMLEKLCEMLVESEAKSRAIRAEVAALLKGGHK